MVLLSSFMFFRLIYIIFKHNNQLIKEFFYLFFNFFFSIFQFSIFQIRKKKFVTLKGYFLPLKFGYFAYFVYIFSQCLRSYSLCFPSLYIHKNVLKILWNQKTTYSYDFWVISSYFVTRIFRSSIYSKKLFEKYMKTKYGI